MKSLVSDAFMDVMRDLAEKAPDGCFVEVGVYQGGTAIVLNEVAKAQGRKLFLYDTFEGMPFADEIDTHPVGMFSECSAEAVKQAIPEATVVKGLFPETLIEMPEIAFVHADADQYRSTKDICDYLGPLMALGGMMLFDDYYAVASCIKAVDECFPNKEILADGRALVRF